MKNIVLAVSGDRLSAPLRDSPDQPASADQQIAEARRTSCPRTLRAGATVVTYDAATGARKVLRQGTNFLECQPQMADGFARCYNKAFAPRRDLEAKLRAAEEERRGDLRRRSRRRSRRGRCRAAARR